jgi:hypothetical protein
MTQVRQKYMRVDDEGVSGSALAPSKWVTNLSLRQASRSNPNCAWMTSLTPAKFVGAAVTCAWHLLLKAEHTKSNPNKKCSAMQKCNATITFLLFLSPRSFRQPTFT